MSFPLRSLNSTSLLVLLKETLPITLVFTAFRSPLIDFNDRFPVIWAVVTSISPLTVDALTAPVNLAGIETVTVLF